LTRLIRHLLNIQHYTTISQKYTIDMYIAKGVTISQYSYSILANTESKDINNNLI